MKWWSRRRQQGLGLVALLVAVALLWSSLAEAFGGSHSKVLLKDVQTLTLHRGKMTTGRRTSPVPQLKCVGGNACGDYEPDVVQCRNAGFDGSDVQWKCEADLPNNLRFGEVEAYCEGYNHPDDPFVLKGSCGVEYSLYYTKVHHNQGRSWDQPDIKKSFTKFKRQSWIETIYLWTWISIVGFILYSFVRNCFQHQAGPHGDAPPPYRASGSGSGGHGGGGGNGGSGGGGSGFGGGWGSGWGNNNNYRPKPTEGERFRPGFWSGLSLGGLATYLAANRNRQPTYRPAYTSSPSWGTSYSQPSASYSQPSTSYTQSSTSYGSSSGAGPSSSSGSSSKSTRTATGFGGTKRR